MAVSKVTTLTSTYDHRVIQGAQSGEFLRAIHTLLEGADNFYEAIFEALRIPYPPIKWAPDNGDYSISLWGRNLTNQTRVVGAIDFNNLTGFLNEPRTWGVEFTAKF